MYRLTIKGKKNQIVFILNEPTNYRIMELSMIEGFLGY